jgi:hypothetical protein
MAKYDRPEYHHMDLQQLLAFGADLDNESLKKYYKALRDRFKRGGQKGQMPTANLLWLSAYPDVLKMQANASEVVRNKKYKMPPKEPELVGAVDGSEHADSTVL